MHVRAKLPSTRDRVQRALLAPAAFDSELLTPVPSLYYLALRVCFHLTFITSCKLCRPIILASTPTIRRSSVCSVIPIQPPRGGRTRGLPPAQIQRSGVRSFSVGCLRML